MWKTRFLWLLVLFWGCARPAPDNALAIIDSHVHLAPTEACLARALALFSKAKVTKFCVKSAGVVGSRRFQATMAIKKRLGQRFAFFSNLDWRQIDDPGWAQREASRLAQAVRQGARGVKIFKALGLGVRKADGSLLSPDDPILDPIMQKAAQPRCHRSASYR